LQRLAYTGVSSHVEKEITMSIKCGGCKEYHDSKEEVQACFARKYAREPASPRQLSFINIRRREDGEEPYGSELTKSAANAQISILSRQGRGPKKYGCQCPPEEPCTCEVKMRGLATAISETSSGALPEGYYATERQDTKEHDFWFVKNGRKPGIQFINRILGGHPPIYLSRDKQAAARTAIFRAGVEAASEAYAHLTDSCRACNIHLTEGASRTLGYGETCAGKRGLGDEWRRLDRQFKERAKAQASGEAV
jgi:hypothetical protein